MSTARDNFGPTNDVQDDTLVNIGGQETTAKVAAELGYLKRNRDGSFSEISYNQKKALGLDVSGLEPPAEEGSSNDPNVQIEAPEEKGEAELMDSETEAEIESLYQKAGDSMAEGFAMDMIKDQNDEKAIRNFAEHLGLDQSELSERVKGVVSKFVDQASGYVKSKYGDKIGDPQDLWDWANQNIPQKSLQRIMQQHWRGDLSGYEALVKDYLVNTKPNSLPNGAKVRTVEGTGKQVVKLPGKPEVEISVASALGWV